MKSKLTVPFVAVLAAMTLIQCKHEPDPAPIVNNPTINVKDSVCFEEEVLPMLASGCAKAGCHDAATRQSGITLDTYENIISTISGQLLLQIIQDTGPNRMPPAPYDRFTTEQIQIVQNWVNQGMKIGVDCGGPCDTTNISFSNTINPIIQNSCVGCHNNGSAINLVGYTNIKMYADLGKLECTINNTGGCIPMPPQGQAQLSACKLAQIRKWIAAGAPNN